MRDAETGEQLRRHPRRRLFASASPRIAAGARGRSCAKALARAGVDTLELSTDDDLADAILRFIDLRRQRERATATGGRLCPVTHP